MPDAAAARSVGDRRARQPAAALRGLPPVLDRQVETLILGSFPSAASLAARRYYAHPRNAFWPILGACLDEPLAALPYRQRLARLLAHRIGLWDVLGACERVGSLDAAIRRPVANDFAILRRRVPRLQRVLFNGTTAGRFAAGFERAGYATRVLPSTSPAHAALDVAAKQQRWLAGLQGLA